jgi:Pyridoxamine 5'-phosphate oxidase
MQTEVSWKQFAADRPTLAEAGRELLYQFGIGLAFLSTVRPDGGPRLHPISPVLVSGRLLVHVIPSPKRDDLHRDPRYALHSFASPTNEDAFYVTGRAQPVTDPDLAASALAQFLGERAIEAEPEAFADGEFFELLLGRCLVTRTTGHGDWRPQHSTWVP